MTTTNLVLVLMGSGFCAGSLGIALLGRSQRRRYARWAAEGTEVEGVVVDIREYYAGNAIRREPLVEFSDRNGVTRRAFGQSNRGLAMEASVRLVYDPDDPESILLAWDVEQGSKIIKVLAIVFGALGAGFLALGAL